MIEHQYVAIKGIKDGLLITLSPTEEWTLITADLATRLDEGGAFFTGAKVTVDFGTRPVPKHELSSLKALLERRKLTLWAVISNSDTTITAANALDVKTSVSTAINVPGRPPTPQDAKQSSEEDAYGGVMLRRTLRSGRTIHSDGHVVIFGDVNPGAQIFAVGDVIIWGKLRGTVHAGIEGDETVVVCALDMMPTQLRIAHHIVTSPKDKRRKSRPEVAMIRDNQIIVEAWAK